MGDIMKDIFLHFIQENQTLSFAIFCLLCTFTIAFFVSSIYKKHNIIKMIPCITNVIQIAGILFAIIWGSGIILEHDLKKAKAEVKDLHNEIEGLKSEKINLICDNKIIAHKQHELETMNENLQKEWDGLNTEINNIKNEKNKISKQNKHIKLELLFNNFFNSIVSYFADMLKSLMLSIASGDINNVNNLYNKFKNISYKELLNHAISQVDFTIFSKKEASFIKNYIHKKISNNMLMNKKILNSYTNKKINYDSLNGKNFIHMTQTMFKDAYNIAQKDSTHAIIQENIIRIEDELHHMIEKGSL